MKKGYLGIIESAYLAGKTAGYGSVLTDRGLPNSIIPLDRMIYVAAFQGGIEKFLTPLDARTENPTDQFISARVSKPRDFDTELLSNLISLLPEVDDEEHNAKALMVLSLLHDLMVAMQNSAAVINVSGIPSAEDIKREFPPDISASLCALFSAFKPSDELLPAPAQVISRDAVSRFEDILSSGVYRQYAAAHELVEVEKSASALAEVRRTGAQLLKQGGSVLASRRVSMNIISVVPNLVDAGFGKLPGSLAKFAADLANRFMEGRKNVVVYQFGDWTNEYALAAVLQSMKRSKGPSDAFGVVENA